jgi:hypothetical protein
MTRDPCVTTALSAAVTAKPAGGLTCGFGQCQEVSEGGLEPPCPNTGTSTSS